MASSISSSRTFTSSGGADDGRGRQRMGHQGVDDPRLDLQEQHPQDVVGDLALPLQFDQPRAVQAEVGQPVGAFALSLDGIGQAPLFPEAADEHLAAELLDHGGNLARHRFVIPPKTVGIENEHAFVDDRGQGYNSSEMSQLY